MHLKTHGIMPRHYTALLHEYLGYFPCVGLIGPRQCGKTTLLGELGANWTRFDLEKQSDFEAISRDPDLFLRLHPDKVVIDEAQAYPALFQALRVSIDADRSRPGRFVITGSSSPRLTRAISESLAGRIGLIEMGPFSLSEALEQTPSLFIEGLVEDWEPERFVNQLRPRSAIEALHEYWLWGGFPQPWVEGGNRFRQVWMEQYVQTYLHRDIGALFPGLNRNRFRRFIQSLAGLSGTILNYAEVGRALDVSQPTARDYFEIADGSFLWRTIPAFTQTARKRVVKRPRGYMRDSGLLHHLLRISDLDLLLGHPQMGRSWEGMIVEQILRGLGAAGIPCEYSHYRTANGAEVDLVLEGRFGMIPIEIKHGQTVRSRDLRAIHDFMDQHGCRLGVVVNNDEHPRLYSPRVIGMPAACL